MQDKTYKDFQFDTFINKTIIGIAKNYYKRQNRLLKREEFYCYDTSRPSLLDDALFELDTTFIDNIDTKIVIYNAIKKLSVIEQAVIFLLFIKDITPEKASRILGISYNSISRIKSRALSKLKKIIKEDF